MPNALVMVCCNAAENGQFDHRARAVEFKFKDDDLQLESTFWNWSPRFAELPDGIRISRKQFAIIKGFEWYGNWCWNAYLMTLPETNRLFEYVRSLKDRKGNPYYAPESGSTKWWERWERGEQLFKLKNLVETK